MLHAKHIGLRLISNTSSTSIYTYTPYTPYTIGRRRLSSYRGGAEGRAESYTHIVVGGAESHVLR